MNIAKFQKIAQIDNSFVCKKCPIKINKGVILYDRLRDLQLLNLVVTNRGNVTVDEIEVKITGYDCYGNPVKEKNGQIGQICRFTDSGCLPDQSIGEGEVILLPSKEVVNCDVLVTRVKTAGNVELVFTEADYELANTPVRAPVKVDGREKNKKLFKGLMIAGGVALGIYLLVFLLSLIFHFWIAPARNESKLESYLENKEYALALRHLGGAEDEAERRALIIGEAVEYSLAEKKYSQALSFAQKSEDPYLYQSTMLQIVGQIEQDEGFEKALDFADDHQNDKAKHKVYEDAVAYYAGQNDFRQALTWVAMSGDASLNRQIYSKAVDHYVAQNDYVTAMEYALKTRENNIIKRVYAPAVLSLMEQKDYDLAALYIARANFPDDAEITSQVKAVAFEKADLNFKRHNAYYFLHSMTLAQKQTLYATRLAARTEAIMVSSKGTVSCTDRAISFSETNATSAAIGDAHAAILLSDGTVVAKGNNVYKQCDTSAWSEIIGIACGEYHTVGLQADGTVVAAGSNDYGQCNVNTWTNIVQVVCGPSYTVGLKSDGTVVVTGKSFLGQSGALQWREVVYLSAGASHLLGLKSDGTVLAAGAKASARCNVSDWANVTAVAAGIDYSVAICKDGTVLMTGSDELNLSKITWNQVTLIAAGDTDVVGLNKGSLAAVGSGELEFSKLKA